MKTLPLHSLILCDASERLDAFPRHEVLDLSAICHQLVGGTRRHDLAAVVYGELRHRLALKLSLGERAVVHLRGILPDQRQQLAALAGNQGASIHTISQKPDAAFGELIHPNVKLKLVVALPVAIEPHLRMQWQGITVVGDVHGEREPLEQALSWAQSRQHFVWFLGDLIDYGKQTLETIAVAHRAVMAGEAAMILANHERKIARWLERNNDHVRLSEGNRVTIDAYERLTALERGRWSGRFRALLAHCVVTQEIGNVSLMHAAAHPSLWQVPDRTAVEQYALYGEADQSGGQYKRLHCWIDAVPAGKIVIVGHDVVADYPMLMTGALGGRVVFLDTGCGKGGRLSSADLRFTDQGLHLECFHRY